MTCESSRVRRTGRSRRTSLRSGVLRRTPYGAFNGPTSHAASAMVEIEESAEAVAPLHVGGRALQRCRGLQKPVVESVMVSLAVVVFDVLPGRGGASGSQPWIRMVAPAWISVAI